MGSRVSMASRVGEATGASTRVERPGGSSRVDRVDNRTETSPPVPSSEEIRGARGLVVQMLTAPIRTSPEKTSKIRPQVPTWIDRHAEEEKLIRSRPLERLMVGEVAAISQCQHRGLHFHIFHPPHHLHPHHHQYPLQFPLLGHHQPFRTRHHHIKGGSPQHRHRHQRRSRALLYLWPLVPPQRVVTD